MFKGLYNLVDLNLQKNIIRTIEMDSFAEMEKLSWLDLAWNELVTIPEAAFSPQGFPLLFLALYENLIYCDWRVCWMKNKPYLYNIYYLGEGPRCAGPTNLYNQLWYSTALDELKCK